MLSQSLHTSLELKNKDSFKEITYLFTLSLVWVVLVFLVNPLGNFPLNDDWVYSLAVKSVLENGYYQFPSPSSANVGPLVYWGALFCLPGGFSFTALRISSLTLGLVGILGMYGLTRTLGGPPKLALLGGLILAVNPLYLGLAHTFMTDVPFLAVVILSLLLLIKSLQRDSIAFLVIGLALAFLAILIRQLGIVVLVGFAAAYLIKHGFRFFNIAKVTALVIAGVMLHFAYQHWLVDSGRTPLLTLHADAGKLHIPTVMMVIKKFLIMLMYTGFFILPVLPVFLARDGKLFGQHKKIFWISALLLIVGFFILFQWTDNILPLTGNILLESGLGPLTLRDTYNSGLNFPSIPPALAFFWSVMTLLSIFAGAVVLYYVAVATRQSWTNFKTARESVWPYTLLIALILSYFAILMIIAASFPLFDRYFLVILPLLFWLMVITAPGRPFQSGAVKLSLVLIFFYAMFSVAATHDYLAWHRARWLATNDLMQVEGAKPQQIDGGYEFNGWYLYDAKYKQSRNKSWWWVVDDEYIIASGPIAGYKLIRRYSFDRWLMQRSSDVWVLQRIAKR